MHMPSPPLEILTSIIGTEPGYTCTAVFQREIKEDLTWLDPFSGSRKGI